MQGRSARRAGTSRKLLALLLALVMLLGLCPTGLLAAETGADTSTESKTAVGKVRVLVENQTASPAAGGGYGEWETGAEQWSGVRVDKEVNLYTDSTGMSCIQEALAGHSVTGADTGYITEVDGLKAGTTSYSGWMISLNDWFPNVGLSDITYANSMLKDGDVICLTYSLTVGKDVGSDYSDSNKKLSNLAVEGATLNPTFSSGVTEYELVIGQVDTATVALTPTAANKNFLTGIYKKSVTLEEAKALAADSWYSDSAMIGRGRSISVAPGDVLTVVVGAPNWPSMSNGSYGCNAENVDPAIYQLKVVQTATETSSAFDGFFKSLDGIATVVNDTESSTGDTTYPMAVDQTENALVSTNVGKGYSYSGITLTFQKAASLSFAYKASSEARYDYLQVTRIAADGIRTTLNGSSKADFSGQMTDYVTYSLEVNAGESIRLAYYKDYSGDSGSDCVWIKDFAAALPHTVILHANDGTDTTMQQGIFGTGNLMANPFTREGYRFQGWASTADGSAAYADGGQITLGDEDVDLYAVWTPVWKVTFPHMPSGARITVKQGDTVIEASETSAGSETSQGDTWILADGTYSYSAQLFGYEAKSDVAFTVAGGDLAIEDGLTAASRVDVTFQAAGLAEGTSLAITVTNSENTQMVPKTGENFAYQLPAGTYSYMAKAAGYKTLKGSLTVADVAQSVELTMTALTAWDGTVAAGFAGGDGSQSAPYEIESGEELSYLSQQIAAGDTSLTADTYYVLTADIDLNHQAFTPIGEDSNHTFSGHFDGNGYTISNLKVDREDNYAGLFGRIKASISNLIIDAAAVTNTSANTGVLAGAVYNGDITISNCVVKNSSVTSSGNYTGGLIGYCGNDVSRCAVLDTTVNGAAYVGGLFGQQSKSVTECYALRIKISASGDYVGGIFGSTAYPSDQKVSSCFARGSLLTTGGTAGGLVGNSTSSYYKPTIQKSYAVMDVTAQGGNAGPIAGGAYVTVADDTTFYSTESTVTASGSLQAGGTGTSLAKLKDAAILSSLGTEFQIYAEEDGIINAGLPYLKNAPALDKILPQSLADPKVSWKDKTVSWTQVEHAAGYQVELSRNSEVIFTENTTDLTKDFGSLIDLSGSGTYLVQVTALGDGENYGNSQAVSEEATFTVTSGSVIFRVSTSDGQEFPSACQPEICLTMADGTTEVTLGNGVAKSLPLGTYSYTVSAKTYVSQKGSFTLTEAGYSQDIALVYSAAWDGETTVKPQLLDGIYQISNGYELAWFRDQVNAALEASSTASCDLKAVVTRDISMGDHDWIAIAKVTSTSAKGGYTGTFDGQGHTISGLKPVGAEVTSYSRTELMGAGLFGYVYTGGVIRNLTVEGSMEAVKYSGGLVAVLAGGSVEHCTNRISMTLKEEISDGYAIGGVVGYMTNYSAKSSQVTLCRNEGAINIGSNGRYVGGIVGNGSYGTGIANCANTGALTSGTYAGGIVGNGNVPVTASYNTGAISATGDYVGGIAGFTNKEIKDCYNTASIQGAGSKNGVGGLVGQLHSEYGGKITGGYNSGNVTATGDMVGALAGAKGGSSAVITRAYYLIGTSTKAIGSNAADGDQTEPISAEKLSSKGIIGLLGGSFASLEGSAYPVLNWQDTDAKSVLTFVLPEKASVTLEGCTAVKEEPGVYILEDGTYSYSVSKTGYTTKEGSVTISGESTSISIELERVTYDVTFAVSPTGATIVVTDEAGETFQPKAEGVFTLPSGTYSYTISKFGFIGQKGSFTVTDKALELPAISLEEASTSTVTLTFTDEEGQAVTPASVTITAADGTLVAPDSSETFVYSLPDGTYTYAVTDSRYYGVEDSFTVSGQALTLPVSLEVNRTWDGTSQTEVTPNAEGIYEISNAAELAWFAAQVNAGNLTYNAKLTANIYVNYKDSTNTWTSIGGYSNQYTGTFDGNGKAIYGLNAALFAYNGSGSLVKNLTVYGSNSGYSNVGGICNASYGSFEGCINHMTVSATGPRVGGIAGILYDSGSISNCANYGDISTSYTGTTTSTYYRPHLGGIVGKSSGNVTGCFNAGNVTASASSYGGTGGITGEIYSAKVTNCYNIGTISGPSRTGGIVGLADSTGSGVENCYNVGTVTTSSSSANPFCGAIAGSIAGSDGSQVGTVNNCFYLENSFSFTSGGTTINGGVGYAGSGVADPTESKTAGQLRLGAFAMALSPTDRAFNMDSDKINSGYPILTWQGGTEPALTQEEQDVVADKAALTVTPTLISAPTQLTLPSQGEKGSAITWTSSNTDVIALDGTVTLPKANDAQVTLTATLVKGDVTDTKTFVITVQTQSSADAAILKTIKEALGTSLRVSYYEGGTNVTEAMEERINTVLYNKEITNLTSADITVTLVDRGTVTYGSGDLIAEDGKVTYYYESPSKAINGDAIVNGATFRLTTASGASVTTDACMVSIPWDQAKVKAEMQKAVDQLTFDTIKGSNTASDQVQTNLTLPQTMENYGWASIGWESSNTGIINVTGGEALTAFTGNVVQELEDKKVTLTATFTFNKNNKDEDGPISLTKELEVTVPGSGAAYMEEIQAALEKYTLDKLTYATGTSKGSAIDPEAVTDNIQLLTSGKLGIDGGKNGYKIQYSVVEEGQNAVSINGYRANVVRPISEKASQVTLRLTLTKQTGGVLNTAYSAYKNLTIQIAPLKPSEIQAELAMLEKVKASFFQGINDGKNVSKDWVTQNLHAFREAYLNEAGEVVWVYNSSDMTDAGIVPADLEGYDSMSTAGWRVFRSSNTAAISHENMLVTCPETEDAEVTIEANLKSTRFGDFYASYAEDATYGPIFKRLAGEPVSVTVKVPSKATQAKAEEEARYSAAISQGSSLTVGEDVSLDITISNKVETSYTTYQLVVNYDADKLTYKSINTNAAVKDQNGVLTITGFGSDRACETDKIVLTFTGKAAGQAEVSLISAKIDQAAHAAERDAPDANIVTPATATLTVKEKVLLGDMNGDGEITNADVAELLAKVTAREEVSLEVGDVNGDGEVTNADVAALLAMVTNG